MKKISLLSLVAVAGMTFVSSAKAMNTENPLYMPKAGNIVMKGQFEYSNLEMKGATGAVTNTDDFQNGDWDDEFSIGYGFSKNFALTVSTVSSMALRANMADVYSSTGETSAPEFAGIFRVMEKGDVKFDLLGSIAPGLQYNEATALSLGFRAGLVMKKMTIAFGAKAGYTTSYDRVSVATGADTGTEVDDNMSYTFTGGAQFELSKDMSLNITGEYFMMDELGLSTGGSYGEINGYNVELGLNFNMKKGMILTPYLSYTDAEQDASLVPAGGWEMMGMSYGLRFGMEF